MSKPLSVDCSKLVLPDLVIIASETELVIRKSPKFSPGGFLQSLLSSVATGQGSLNQIASELKDRTHAAMARQSMHDRFTTKSTAFGVPPFFEPTLMRVGLGLGCRCDS